MVCSYVASIATVSSEAARQLQEPSGGWIKTGRCPFCDNRGELLGRGKPESGALYGLFKSPRVASSGCLMEVKDLTQHNAGISVGSSRFSSVRMGYNSQHTCLKAELFPTFRTGFSTDQTLKIPIWICLVVKTARLISAVALLIAGGCSSRCVYVFLSRRGKHEKPEDTPDATPTREHCVADPNMALSVVLPTSSAVLSGRPWSCYVFRT